MNTNGADLIQALLFQIRHDPSRGLASYRATLKVLQRQNRHAPGQASVALLFATQTPDSVGTGALKRSVKTMQLA
jgi:hypothetical protein